MFEDLKVSGVEIVERIDMILEQKNIKRVKLCNDIGASVNIISNWATRGTIPSADVMYKIAKYLGVSMDWLITGRVNQDDDNDKSNLDESYLLSLYRTFPEDIKKQTIIQVRVLASLEAAKKKVAEKNNKSNKTDKDIILTVKDIISELSEEL